MRDFYELDPSTECRLLSDLLHLVDFAPEYSIESVAKEEGKSVSKFWRDYCKERGVKYRLSMPERSGTRWLVGWRY